MVQDGLGKGRPEAEKIIQETPAIVQLNGNEITARERE